MFFFLLCEKWGWRGREMGAFADGFYASALAKCHGCCRLRGCMEPGGSMANIGPCLLSWPCGASLNAKLCLPNCCFLFAGFCFLLQESISKSALLRCAIEFSGRILFWSSYLFLGQELQLCLLPTPLLCFLPSSTYCSFLIEMRKDLLAGPRAFLLGNSLLTDRMALEVLSSQLILPSDPAIPIASKTKSLRWEIMDFRCWAAWPIDLSTRTDCCLPASPPLMLSQLFSFLFSFFFHTCLQSLKCSSSSKPSC